MTDYELTVDGSPVWMKSGELTRGGLTRLSGAGVIKATGLLPDGYAALCDYLPLALAIVPPSTEGSMGSSS